MPTPNLDRLAAEGMMFMSFYAQPSCTPGRAAMQTGRIPNRSGMTTVAFQGQGGGLPAAEWTLASVLKTGGYKTFFTGKWHLGEADYALPNAQGYDEMKYAGLYHLNAYTYGDPTWFPDMAPELRAMFQQRDQGRDVGQCRPRPRTRTSRSTDKYVNTPDKGVVGIPFFDEYVEKASLDYLDRNGKSTTAVLHEHQLHEGAPAEHAGSRIRAQISVEEPNSQTSMVENDTRIGRIMDKVRALGLDKNTYVFWTTDNGAWQDVYPDAGYTPFRGTKGTVREGGVRVPAIAWGPRSSQISRIPRSSVAWTIWPRSRACGVRRCRERSRRQADHFRQLRYVTGAVRHRQVAAKLTGSTSPRTSLPPAPCASADYKAVFNLRGDDGVKTGGLAVDSNLGWKGAGELCRHRSADV